MCVDERLPPAMVHRSDSAGRVGSWSRWRISATATLITTLLGMTALLLEAVVGVESVNSKAAGRMLSEEVLTEPGAVDVLLVQLRRLGGKDPTQEYPLHSTAGNIYREQGRFSDASVHYAKAVDLAQNNHDRVVALVALGSTKLHKGHLSDAHRHLEKAVALADRGSEHAVAAIHALANVHRDLGHADESIRLYKQAWELGFLHRDMRPSEMPLLAADAGEAHAQRGLQQQALVWFKTAQKQAMAIKQRLHHQQQEGQPYEAQIHSLLGAWHHQAGQVNKAMELYQKALRVQARVLHATNTDLIGTRLSIARAQRDLGDHNGAQRTAMAVEFTLRSGALEGPDLSRCLVLKADLLREAKRLQEAKSAIQEAIHEQEKTFIGESPEVAMAMSTLGSVLHDEGKLEEAHQYYMKALLLNENTVGEWHPETAATHNSLGTLYEDTNNLKQARIHFKKCLEIQLASVGKSSPEVANTYNNLATVMFRQGAEKEAAALLKKALKVMDAAGIPSTNPDRAVYKDNLGQVLEAIANTRPVLHAA